MPAKKFPTKVDPRQEKINRKLDQIGQLQKEIKKEQQPGVREQLKAEVKRLYDEIEELETE